MLGPFSHNQRSQGRGALYEQSLPARQRDITVKDLPQHLVVFMLWLYAIPTNLESKAEVRITSAADVKTALEKAPGAIHWFGGRPLFYYVSRGRFNPCGYDAANGLGVARAAISDLRAAIEELTRTQGTRQKAIDMLTDMNWSCLRPPMRRFFPRERAIIEALVDEVMRKRR